MTSSSSECDDSDYYGAQGFGPTPNINQPFIYYAQIPNQRKTQNTNYFLRAFHWYSQERGPCKKELDNVNDMKGFASWLDDKYDEYLLSGQANYEGPKNSFNNTREKKKNKRSPWRRRKKAAKLEERANASTQSIRVILKPKNLVQTISECCQSSKTEPCCPQCAHIKCPISIATAPISGNEFACRSKSALSFLQETEIQVIPFDYREDTPNRQLFWMPLQTVEKPEFQIQYWNTVLPSNAERREPSEKKPNKGNLKTGPRSYKDMSSQFSQSDKNRNTNSQFDFERKKKSLHECKCPEDKTAQVAFATMNSTITTNQTCPCTTEESEPLYARQANAVPNQHTPDRPDLRLPNQQTSDRSDLRLPNQQIPNPLTPAHVDCSAQTSDHSIKLEYPTYMRIVRADKLNEL